MQIHYLQLSNWEVVQLVEHWSPKSAVVGSTPAFSAIMGMSSNWSGSYSDKVVMKVQVLVGAQPQPWQIFPQSIDGGCSGLLILRVRFDSLWRNITYY